MSVAGTLCASLTPPSTQPDLRRHFARRCKYLFGLRMNFAFYFDKIFAGSEAGGER